MMFLLVRGRKLPGEDERCRRLPSVAASVLIEAVPECTSDLAPLPCGVERWRLIGSLPRTAIPGQTRFVQQDRRSVLLRRWGRDGGPGLPAPSVERPCLGEIERHRRRCVLGLRRRRWSWCRWGRRRHDAAAGSRVSFPAAAGTKHRAGKHRGHAKQSRDRNPVCTDPANGQGGSVFRA